MMTTEEVPQGTPLVADGWYKVTDPTTGLADFEKVVDGYADDGNGAHVNQCIEWGYTFEPAVVMTQAEHDDVQAALARLTQERDHWRQQHADCTTSLITADRQIERLRAALGEQGEWQTVNEVRCDCNDGKCEKRIVLAEGINGSRSLFWHEDSMIYLPVGEWRLQQRTTEGGGANG